jgi:hypothetical protein
MSTPSVPLISALPQFNAGLAAPDDLAAASPIYQALLAQTGGNLQNVNSLAASQPNFAPALSLMGPGGGLNPAQASQFGPLFGLLMSLWGQGGQTPQPTPGQGL